MRLQKPILSLALAALCSSGLQDTAFAFNPDEGAEPAPVYNARYQPLPSSVVPPRYYDPTTTPLPITAAARPAPAPQVIAPPPITPAPAIVAAPVATRQIPAEQPAAMPAPVSAYPVAAPAVYGYAPAAPLPPAYQPSQTSYNSTFRTNRFSLGAQGFWDRYREDIASLQSDSGYGAITGGWEHYFTPQWFTRTELRGSLGDEHYKSTSGTSNGTTQWEFEGRLLAGFDLAYDRDTHVKPYIGLDMRYYRDEGKDTFTNLGFEGYDRRIFQTMLPVGVTYEFPAYGLHFAPTIEGGPLLYGNVSTRLENIPGYYQITNHQHSGYELRGDFLTSALHDDGRGWQFGPFVRYWHFDDSDVAHTPPAGPDNATDWIEPKNSRLQLGAELNYLF